MRRSQSTVNGARILVPFVLIAACAFSLLSHSSAASSWRADSAPISTSTREGRLAVFDDAWATINDRYYDRTFHGVDWEGDRLLFRAKVADTNSSEELYEVMRSMIAGLDDPHTRVFAPEEKFDWWHPRFISIGVAVRAVNGLPTVVKVEPHSLPERAGMRIGDVIQSVDGLPALSLIEQKLMRMSNPESASSRYRAFARLMDGPADSLANVRWIAKNGKENAATFTRRWEQRELGIRVRRLKGNYAVLEIDAFSNSIANSFAPLLREKLNGSRGIIIDLRNNGGGDSQAMADIASAFLGAGFALGEFTDRAGASFTLATHPKSLLTATQINTTTIPLVVLTSEATSSAAEIFVAALQNSSRATIIGTETCGCVLAIRARHELPDGGLLDVSELDYQTANGQRLEGRGLKPDQTLAVRRNDLYHHRDRAIEVALNKLEHTSTPN